MCGCALTFFGDGMRIGSISFGRVLLEKLFTLLLSPNDVTGFKEYYDWFERLGSLLWPWWCLICFDMCFFVFASNCGV